MKHKFLSKYNEDTVYNIDFNKYYNKGYKLLIFDIDNTLVLHDEPANENVKQLINKLKNIGFNIALLSNNDINRVETFANDIGVTNYIYNANKPSPVNYLNIINKYKELNKSQVLFVGDQLLTDIYGSNLANIDSICVKPIGKEIHLHVKFKRLIEKLINFYYKYIIRIYKYEK